MVRDVITENVIGKEPLRTKFTNWRLANEKIISDAKHASSWTNLDQDGKEQTSRELRRKERTKKMLAVTNILCTGLDEAGQAYPPIIRE
jgi:hypothetical protein